MSGTTWVYIMLGLYIIYAFYWGIKGYVTEKTSAGYAIGGRSIPFIAFLMAATAASFSGWTFIGHPGLIWRDGLAYAFASFYVLTIPITGTFFAKRNWLLGKRYGFITPGDMFAYYYNSETVRFLVVLTAFLYSMFYSAVQLMASAALFHYVAGVPVTFGAIFMAFICWFYVCSGGMKASAWVGVLQFFLLVGGIILMGYFVVTAPAFGGWTGFSQELAKLDKRFLEVPRVINWGLGGAKGEVAWTAVMCLTYMFALMGIQSSPAFTMWNFGQQNPKPLAWQQAFMSTFVVGFALFFFTAFQGMGAKILAGQGLDGIRQGQRRGAASDDAATCRPSCWGWCSWGPSPRSTPRPRPTSTPAGRSCCATSTGATSASSRPSHAEQIWVNRLLATVVTVAALCRRVELHGGPRHPGGARHGLRLRHVRAADGRQLGLPLPGHRRHPRGPGRHGGGLPDLLRLAEPALHAQRLLGGLRRAGGGLCLPRPSA